MSTEQKPMSFEELKIKMEGHKAWYYDVDLGNDVQNERANIENADLSHALTNLPLAHRKQVDVWCFRDAKFENVTLSRAYLAGVDFNGAEFYNCQFQGANLSDCDFTYAQFVNCDMRDVLAIDAFFRSATFCNCNLEGGSFNGAGFKYAEFISTDLTKSYLHQANLASIRYHDGDRSKYPNRLYTAPVCRLDFGTWSVVILPTKTQIGCQRLDNDKWLALEADSPVVADMNEKAPAWWKLYGEAVKSAIRAVQATANLPYVDSNQGAEI